MSESGCHDGLCEPPPPQPLLTWFPHTIAKPSLEVWLKSATATNSHDLFGVCMWEGVTEGCFLLVIICLVSSVSPHLTGALSADTSPVLKTQSEATSPGTFFGSTALSPSQPPSPGFQRSILQTSHLQHLTHCISIVRSLHRLLC